MVGTSIPRNNGKLVEPHFDPSSDKIFLNALVCELMAVDKNEYRNDNNEKKISSGCSKHRINLTSFRYLVLNYKI